MNLVIISDMNQYSTLLCKGVDLSRTQIVCDNPRFAGFLDGRHDNVYLLDEFMIPEDKRKEINAWGCDAAAKWIRVAKEEGCFSDTDLPSCVFLRLGYILVQMRKNKAYVDHIMDKFSPESVVVFKFERYPQYPTFSGNIFINEFLAEICKYKRVKFEYLEVRFSKDQLLRGLVSREARAVAFFRELFRFAIDGVYGRLARAKRTTRVLVRGAKKHLIPIVHELKERGVDFALYDNNFQFKMFDMAKRKGIPYYITSSFGRSVRADKKKFIANLVEEVRCAFDIAIEKGVFFSEDIDLSRLVKRSIFNEINGFCEKLAYLKERWDNIFASCDLEALILDEDTTPESAFAASVCVSHGVKNFCISHATMPVNFEVSSDNKVFGHSTTFVNSEFEKLMYEARGWDGSRIRSIGVPRFDKLFSRCSKEEEGRSADSKGLKFLYCGASMKQYWPERGGYLGLHITNYGDFQRSAIRSILKAINGMPVEFIAKPHNYEGQAWKNFFNGEKTDISVRVEPYTADFYKLLRECDVMVLSHWSTAIIEAILCGKPAVLFDPFNSSELAPYSEIGWFKTVNTEEDLKDVLHGLCDELMNGGRSLRASEDVVVDNEKRRYILGQVDGRNTSRIVNYLEQELRSFG
ncbi:MAG: hypothetical protein KKC50_05230 [Candidatus Omnitrophica bacterium]|nr:hypothetical protein [Candidatus Omnitrophota bacterium]